MLIQESIEDRLISVFLKKDRGSHMGIRKEYWTQGTEEYVIGPSLDDPNKLVMFKINGITDFSPPEPSKSEFDITTLDETEGEKKMTGLRGSSEATYTCNYLEDDPGQVYLSEMDDKEVALTFVTGFSKGKGIEPILEADGYKLPNTRGWLEKKAEVSKYVIQTPKDSAMQLIIGTKVSGKPKLYRVGQVE